MESLRIERQSLRIYMKSLGIDMESLRLSRGPLGIYMEFVGIYTEIPKNSIGTPRSS